MSNIDIQTVKQRFMIIGDNPILNRAIDVAVQVASTDLSVLITGESGVGKERFPQIIHQYSKRTHSPYIAVNCGAIPEGTIDSELFGHEKGAFTGAVSERKGYFEAADKGTIFLDEVGELPLTTQVRLLRVLETGEFMKVGSSKVLKTDVRVVAATNMDMGRAIAEGRFREDLYYRLNSVPIVVPPLRERGMDIYLLFRKFARDFSDKYKMPAITLTAEAQQLLLRYTWPGNVRQLKNVTEQISVLETAREITVDVLRRYLPSENITSQVPVLSSQVNAGKNFSNEVEILYQVLFDMKKDMNDLKKLVHDIIQSGKIDMDAIHIPEGVDLGGIYTPKFEDGTAVVSASSNFTSPPTSKISKQQDIEDTEEYQEENFSLEEVEKEMIKKALERHNNKRKYAAQDLKISERTLYRKIKEYGLE